MDYLSIGQMNIPVAGLAFLIAILFSDLRSRRAEAFTSKAIEQIFFLYVIIWKSSYILFSWNDFGKAPLSILYFDGGEKGHVLALVVIAIVLFYKRKSMDWQMFWHYWSRFIAVYHIIIFSFQEQWFVVALWLALLVIVEFSYNNWLMVAQWLLLVWLGGFGDGFTQVHGGILLTLLLKTKQVQYLAATVIVSLVAMMLTDIQQTNTAPDREDIDLRTTTGEHYRLSEQEQSLTVVNFFATWCPPCKAEMPHLQSFSEDLPSEVAIVGINLTARDDGRKALTQFMDTFDVTYPILLDENDAFGDAYQVLSIPTTVLLNQEGQEVERIVGPISEHALRKLVEQYQ
ncbi:Thiol-disulfide isomerase or thioredoxin [Psychrobacillus sp. OK028]|uniref:TlpA family protein disulfide reductase n=1 Tax=Psychrobacillus sp. OK028 TaxID=1884359 RepID=UPI000887D8C5|nr:TlpA disulfide reductase family protein [Psychrobacillus sp. OK028]SDN42755.1 Thiol-disulfide isomerase or thioredoxin [Psychrobacillus sp. OK028]